VVTMLADIGARTTVIIARGRTIEFLKTIPIGGATLNRAVAECLDMAPSEAEGLRRRLGAQRSNETVGDPVNEAVARTVADAVRPHVEDLASEIGLCLRYHTVTFRSTRPEAITFSGGESHNVELITSLGERLGLAARVGEPLRGVRTDSLAPALDRRQGLADWATAFGLSLKGFHLAAQVAAGYAA
jgi:type IV pilus assembly protein PilM